MAITHQQFIQLLSEKLGLTTDEVSVELDQLIEQIQTATAKGEEFTIDKFGTFKLKNGRLSFEVDPTFALEVNYKYAGMTPVELKGGKTAMVSDDEAKDQPDESEPEPEEKTSEEKTVESESEKEELKSEEEGKEKTEESEEVDNSESEPDWLADFISGGSDEKESDDKEEKKEEKPDQERAHIYRSPNRLLNEDELPKRRSGLFVVIVLVLAVLFAGYYFIVRKGSAPVAENAGGQSQSDTVYVHEDNVKPAVRQEKRNTEEDTAKQGAVVGGMADTTQIASNMVNSGANKSTASQKTKKTGSSNTAAVSATVAKKDSVAAKKITNELSETSLYGLHGKASNEIGDYYTIVVASFQDQDKAGLVSKRWKNRNYRVVVAPGHVHGQIWYRVGLGQFSSVSEAEHAVKELPNRLQDNQHHFIRRIHQ